MIKPVTVLVAEHDIMVDIAHHNLAMMADIDYFISQISFNL